MHRNLVGILCFHLFAEIQRATVIAYVNVPGRLWLCRPFRPWPRAGLYESRRPEGVRPGQGLAVGGGGQVLSPELCRRFRKAPAGLHAPAFRLWPRFSPAHEAWPMLSLGSCSGPAVYRPSGSRQEPLGGPDSWVQRIPPADSRCGLPLSRYAGQADLRARRQGINGRMAATGPDAGVRRSGVAIPPRNCRSRWDRAESPGSARALRGR